jgi:RHS repeat-associated protein
MLTRSVDASSGKPTIRNWRVLRRLPAILLALAAIFAVWTAGTRDALASPPTAPQNVAATAGANQATVTWQAPSSNGGSAITAYKVTAYIGTTARNATYVAASATTATLTGLAGSTSFTFQVIAINADGSSPPGTSSAVTPTGSTSTYASTVLADGAVAYYRLDDAATQAADSSSNGRDGTYAGTFTQNSGGVLLTDGDAALNFAGGYMKAGGSAGLPSGNAARSLEAWLKATGDGTLLSYGGSGCNSYFQLGLTSGRITLALGCANSAFMPPYPIQNSTWHHVVVTWDGSTLVAYLDGQQIGTQALSALQTTATNLAVGAEGDNNCCTFANATIDEAAVYPAALTATQVLNHFNLSGNSRPTAATNVTATAGANQATVSWTAVTASAGAPVTSYRVASNAGNATFVAGTATSATLTGLKGGSAFTFAVTAANSFGTGPTSSPSAAVTPTGATSTYASTILADGASGYYRSDDAVGLAADSSGNSRDGLYNGSYTQGASGALVSDGDTSVQVSNGGSVSAKSSSWLPTGNAARTMEAWVKTGGDGVLVGYGGGSCNTYFLLRLTGGQLGVQEGCANQNFPTPYPIENSTWHQVVASWDGTTLAVYLDGQSIGSQTLPALATTGSYFAIGLEADNGCCGFASASLDEVAAFPSALTASQILNHFNQSGNSRPTAPTNVTATAGANQATVTWTAATASVGAPVTSYRVATGAGNAMVVGGSATSATLTGLKGGTAYSFTVTAANSFGSGPASLASPSVTPTGSMSTYASTVLGDAPAVYYRLGDGTVAAADSSSNLRDGTYGGTYTQTQSGALLNDPDRSFHSAGGSVSEWLPGAGLPAGNAPRTVEAWVNTTTDGVIVGYGGGSCSTYFLLRYVSGQVGVQEGCGANQNFAAAYPIENRTWHYVAATYDGSTLTVYLDGQSVGTAALGAQSTSAANFALGAEGDNGCCGFGNAYLDEVAVYPTALSAAKILAHFNAANYAMPSTPTNLKVLAGPQNTTLSWTQSAGAASAASYVVTPYLNGIAQPAITVTNPAMTNVAVPNLQPGGAYTFTVKAHSNFGDSGVSVQSPSATPSTPLVPGRAIDSVGVFVGYADTVTAGGFTPTPWVGTGTYDQGGILLSNSTSAAITVDSVDLTVGSTNQHWASGISVPAGGTIVVAAPSDTSDLNTATTCANSGAIPAVHVSAGGITNDYYDWAQVLITHGIAWFACSFNAPEAVDWTQVGGPQGPGEVLLSNECEKCAQKAHGDPISAATGDFSENFADLFIPGRGIPLSFTHGYNSLTSQSDGPLGYGWTGSFNMSLTEDPTGGGLRVAQEGGSVVTFVPTTSGYKPPARVLATLVKNSDGTFTFSRADQTKYAFNPRGELTSETDRNGYTTAFSYTNDQLTSVTDPAGRTVTISYTGSQMTGLQDSSGRSVGFQYDANGNLQQVTDVNNGVTKFTYDTKHLLLTKTDPNNGVVTNVYDSSGRVTSQTDAMNRASTYSYAGGQTTFTDPANHVTVETYQNYQLISETKGYGTPQAATWQYAYDPVSQGITSITDPNNHVTRNTWDPNGNLLTHTDALNRTTTYTYDALNDVLTVKDPLNVTTTNAYDVRGNLASTSRPLTGTSQTATVTYAYDPNKAGDMTSMADSDGKIWHYVYDQYGNRIRSVDPLGNTTTYAYDTIGRMTSTVSPKGNVAGCGCASQYTTSHTYNPFGDPLTVTDPLGHQTVNQYDAVRNMTRVTDANNHATSNTYDKDNEVTVVTRADTTTVVTDYNPDGTVLDQRDGKGNAILTYAYDALARVTSTTDPLGNVTSLAYDGAGNRLSRQDTSGNCGATPKTGCTTYTYDVANELIGITYSDGVTPNVSSITYDADGQRTAMTDGTGTSSWNWDSLHRLASYTNGNGSQVQYTYNLRNLLTTITYPGSLNVTRAYDDAGRFTSVQDWLSNTTTFGYDANSNLTTETLPTGTGVMDTYTFDAANRVMGISDVKGGSTNLFLATYTRDSTNRLSSDSSAPTATGSYHYTTINQLCYAAAANATACTLPPPSSTAYAYDAGDNLTQMGTTQQVFNAADELCWTAPISGSCASPPPGATTYTYDTRGNRTKVTQPTGSATNLSYDQANRLTAYGSSATYSYNGDGLRMSKTTSATTSQFVWDDVGDWPLILKDGATAYIYGPEGLPLEQIGVSATVWLHHDQLGSTRLVTDSSGATSASYTYDAFGKLTASTGSTTNPLQFAGEYQDSESGQYYLRARYYDPTTGSFISRDPLLAVTRQPYGYADDSPVNITDPTGRCIPVCVIIGLAVVFIVVTDVELWKAGYFNNVHYAKPTDERMSDKPPNYRQNKQVRDVCNDHGLTTNEREVLQRELEDRARAGDRIEGYRDIEQVAQELRLGDFATPPDEPAPRVRSPR